MVRLVQDRIANATGIPQDNYEHLQLLRYDLRQYDRPHNDFTAEHTKQGHGPRLLTFLLYFNEVAEGGGRSSQGWAG